MSWDDLGEKHSKEEKAKNPIYRSVSTGHYYCIYRIGKKFKTIGQIKQFVNHTERMKDTPNADASKQNIIVIGTKDLTNDIKAYISDCKYIRANCTIARELLLTASPGFFKGMPESEFDSWVELNKKWLLKEFGDNIRYATLHLDESTPHFHILLVPKVKNKKGEWILSNCRYFDGKDKMREWQDKYANEMQTTFKTLNRGIKWSKSKHIQIRHFYTMVNTQLNEQDLKQVCAKAQNSELLEIKVKAIQNTLNTYRDYSRKTDAEKQQLLENNLTLKKNLKELKQDKEVFHEALQVMSQTYKLPQNAIKSALKYAENNLSNDKER
jgi:hypothetical protein